MSINLPFDYDAFHALLLDDAGETFYLFALHATEDLGAFCILADSEEALDRTTHLLDYRIC